MDAAGALVLVQRLDDWPDRQARVVAVKQVQVDVARAQALERLADIAGDIGGRDALAPLHGVRALANDHHLLAHAARANPGA